MKLKKTKSARGTGSKTALSRQFISALSYAARLHANQIRKRTERPYIGHLLGVASLVIEYGGDEEMAIALLEREGVLIHPGHFFDFPGSGYLVASLIAPEEDFREGMGRVLRAIDRSVSPQYI